MPFKTHTDYPFIRLGDEAHTEALIREVEVVNYDGNKYCQIIVEGIEAEVKSGYLYSEYGRYGSKPISIKDLRSVEIT